MVAYFVMLGITMSTAVAMEKFLFSPALDSTKLEAEDLLHRGAAGALPPVVEVE